MASARCWGSALLRHRLNGVYREGEKSDVSDNGRRPTLYIIAPTGRRWRRNSRKAQAEPANARGARTGLVNGDKGANLIPEYGGGDEHGAIRAIEGLWFGVVARYGSGAMPWPFGLVQNLWRRMCKYPVWQGSKAGSTHGVKRRCCRGASFRRRIVTFEGKDRHPSSPKPSRVTPSLGPPIKSPCRTPAPRLADRHMAHGLRQTHTDTEAHACLSSSSSSSSAPSPSPSSFAPGRRRRAGARRKSQNM
ncbi:hypothetical protein DFH94DRAFT_832573 [Russula ochroleuca]|uniref:Uncharacterized protein n=1 Tax=Russula ochroleuca TaxID=152965 RepID=A0A9P5MVL3_9AGAM|nr:hypothetical protein DFH94DRAFT_832573 [Russula ochroleuca]